MPAFVGDGGNMLVADTCRKLPRPDTPPPVDGWLWDEEIGWWSGKVDRVWTMNEIRDHPMFMEDMPRNIDDNPYLLALQSIVYDGNTPEEMADHFRKLGNDAFRLSENKIASLNALASYSKGLEMECKDDKMNSQLHSNRAAVSLRLKEYDKAVDDCKLAIKLDPTNTKATFRASKASEALGLTSQALEFCAEAKKLAPKEAEIAQAYKRLTQRLAREDAERAKIKQAEEAAEQALRAVGEAVRSVVQARGLKLAGPVFELQGHMAMYRQRNMEVKPVLADDDATAIRWPVVFLYDESGQSDFVEACDERSALEDQLQIMFPADRHVDWDDEGKYVWDKLICYLETHHEDGAVAPGEHGRFLPIPLDAALQDTLQQAVVVPTCLAIHVQVDGTAAHEAFCKKHGISFSR